MPGPASMTATLIRSSSCQARTRLSIWGGMCLTAFSSRFRQHLVELDVVRRHLGEIGADIDGHGVGVEQLTEPLDGRSHETLEVDRREVWHQRAGLDAAEAEHVGDDAVEAIDFVGD
jgi:hypothetical protein